MTDWRRHVHALLPVVTGDARRDDDIRDELVQHCVERVDDLIRSGVPAPDADARVRDELMALARRHRELARSAQHREPNLSGGTARTSTLLSPLREDVRSAVRGLRRAPVFTTVVVGIVGLAVAAAMVAFAVVRGVLLRPLPFPDPDRLVRVWEISPSGNARNPVASGNYLDWTARAQSFARLAAMQGPFDVILSGRTDPERVRGVIVTASFGDVLRVAPLRGRWFDEKDAVPGGPSEVVATFAFWERRLGAREDVIGQPLTLAGRSATLIGVLPPSAAAVLPDVDVVYPARLNDAARAERRSHNYAVVGRLRAGTTMDQANAEMRAIVASLTQQYPADLTNWSVSVVSLHDDEVRDIQALLSVLFAIVVVVIAIACANLGNLQLARASARSGELAVRAALGASRRRLASLMAIESLSLAGAGGCVGALLAVPALATLLARLPIRLPFADSVLIDASVAGFGAGIALVCAAAMTGAALASLSRSDATRLSAETSRITGVQQRFRHVLIAAQVALSLVLLIGAALLGQSLLNVRAIDHGFDPEHLLAVRLDLSRARYPDGPAQIGFYARLLERLRAAPGVAAAAGTTGQPAVAAPMTFSFAIYGRPSQNPTGREHPVPLQAVTDGYFEAMRIPVRAGRTFTPDDRAGQPGVVIINDALARLHWPDGSAVGQRLSFRPGQLPWLEVVGIVGDTRDDGLDQAAPPTIYLPLAQKPDSWAWMSWQTLVVRGRDDASALVPTVRAIVRDIDPQLPLLEATPISSWFLQQGAARRFAVQLSTAFAVLAVLLGAIGIHGVLAYTVHARRREIAIRIALGGPRRRVLGAVVRTTMAFTIAGLVAGAVSAATLTRFLDSLLFGITPLDAPTFVAVGVLLLVVAAAAAWLPARRALRVSSAMTLRQ